MSSMTNLKIDKLGNHITTLTDYHANGSYENLKKHVTLLDKKDYAVMIRTTNFEKEDFNRDLKYIDKNAYEFMEKSKVYPDDIVMNKIANAGSVYRMPNLQGNVSLAMNLFLIRTNENSLNQVYAYYYLRYHERYVKSFANGTATKTITKEAVRNLDIILPGLGSQETVASVLSAYDDLVRVNKLRIINCESTLSLLFDKLMIRTQAQQMSSMGLDLTEYVDFVKGIEPGSKSYLILPGSDNVPFLRVGDLNKQASQTFVNREFVKDNFLEPEDVAMTFDGTIGVVKTGLSGAYSSGIRKAVVKNPALSTVFVYCLLKSRNIQKILQAHSRGTTIKHAASAIPHFKFDLPSELNMSIFNSVAAPILREIRCFEEINIRTASARDDVMHRIFGSEAKLV